MCNDDDNLGARPCVQAPRNRTPTRLGMPRSAFEVEGGHGSVAVDGFESAERVLSRHTDPIGHSVPLSVHDIHQTHRSTYRKPTQLPLLVGDPGYTHTAYTANRDVGIDDELSHESSLQMGGKDFGASSAWEANVSPALGFGGNSVPRTELTIPAPGEPAGRPAGTPPPYVHADVISVDEARTARTYTHPRTHASEGAQPFMQSKPTHTYTQPSHRLPSLPDPPDKQHARTLHTLTSDPKQLWDNKTTQAYTLHTAGDRAEFLQCTPSALTALADKASGTSLTCADVYMPVGHNTQPTHPTQPTHVATTQREEDIPPLPVGFADASRRTHYTVGTCEPQQQYTIPAGTQDQRTMPVCYGT